eukprot:3152476-Pyramimonas_sp.AAC.1
MRRRSRWRRRTKCSRSGRRSRASSRPSRAWGRGATPSSPAAASSRAWRASPWRARRGGPRARR